MNDRELLELAAKAAGYEVVWGDVTTFADETVVDCSDMLYIKTNGAYWNPLIDDTDAFRLAVKLGIDLEWRNDGRVAAYRHANANGNCFTAIESTREDRYASTRRAIVRAAAEIGREME